MGTSPPLERWGPDWEPASVQVTDPATVPSHRLVALTRTLTSAQSARKKLNSQFVQSVCPAVGPGQTLFGNTQNKLGTTLGTMGTFGTTGFNSGTSTLGFGATQPVGEWPHVLEMRTD